MYEMNRHRALADCQRNHQQRCHTHERNVQSHIQASQLLPGICNLLTS